MRYSNSGYHTVAVPTMQAPATLMYGRQYRGYYHVTDVYNNPASDDRMSATKRAVQAFLRANKALGVL